MGARNPLFLRDEALDGAREILLLADRELVARGHEVRRKQGLSETGALILTFVQRHPTTTSAELCQVLGLAKQSLSRHVAGLVAAGLLGRAAGAGDRRKRPLAVTEAGSACLAELAQHDRRRLRRAFLAAGPEAVEGFTRVLGLLVEGPGRRLAARRAA